MNKPFDPVVKQVPSPDEWAQAMPDDELLDRMVGWADAELPQAVALEVKKRFLGHTRLSRKHLARIRENGPYALKFGGNDGPRGRFYNAVGNIEFDGSNSDSLNEALLTLLNEICRT